jgi:hypothetical protein
MYFPRNARKNFGLKSTFTYHSFFFSSIAFHCVLRLYLMFSFITLGLLTKYSYHTHTFARLIQIGSMLSSV